MPSVPVSKKCKFFGCKEASCFGTAFCQKHGAKRSEKYKKNADLYNSAGWRSIRKQQLSKHPICAACFAGGIIKQTEHIDHVIPHRQDTERFLVNVFQGLCAAHHTQKTTLENQGIYRHYTPAGPIDYKDSDYYQLIQKKFHAEIS